MTIMKFLVPLLVVGALLVNPSQAVEEVRNVTKENGRVKPRVKVKVNTDANRIKCLATANGAQFITRKRTIEGLNRHG
jgi:hypothetical protein